MSALRSPRTTAWQAERQPRGSFGHTRCAFYPLAISMDISVPLGTTLHFHSTPQCTSLLPKVIDFRRINWYMWSKWNGNISTTDQHHREKHRSRMAVLTNSRSPSARHCRQQHLNVWKPQPIGSDDVDGDDGYWMLCCLRHGGEVQTAALHHLTRRMT